MSKNNNAKKDKVTPKKNLSSFVTRELLITTVEDADVIVDMDGRSYRVSIEELSKSDKDLLRKGMSVEASYEEGVLKGEVLRFKALTKI